MPYELGYPKPPASRVVSLPHFCLSLHCQRFCVRGVGLWMYAQSRQCVPGPQQQHFKALAVGLCQRVSGLGELQEWSHGLATASSLPVRGLGVSVLRFGCVTMIPQRPGILTVQAFLMALDIKPRTPDAISIDPVPLPRWHEVAERFAKLSLASSPAQPCFVKGLSESLCHMSGIGGLHANSIALIPKHS